MSTFIDDISQARCCVAQGCFDCDDRTNYETTYPLLTLYYRDLGPEESVCRAQLPEANYTPYKVFCLKTKLQAVLYSIDPTFRPGFSKKQLYGVMRLTVDIYKGGEFFPLEKQMAEKIQKQINYWQTKYPDHCLVLDARIPIQEESYTYPLAWVSSIIRFLDVDCCFDAIIEEGRVYINLKEDVQYIDRHFEVYKQIRSTLQDYFERGIVPLSPRIHAKTIDDWKLERVNEIPLKTLDELALYEPLWEDTDFAPNRVDFIYRRLMGNTSIEMFVGSNYMRRHAVAQILTFPDSELLPTFFRDRVMFQASNIEETFEIANRVRKASAESSGLVEIIPIEDETKARIIVGKNPEAVLYRVLDNPEYTMSFKYAPGSSVQPKEIITYMDVINPST